MARNKRTEIELTAYDDLFQTDESREEARLSKIRDIPIAEIDEFPDHPFKVLMDEDMEQLVDSIKRSGNLVSMTFTYPEVTTIDTFYTTADGELITPQTLEYGTGYSLVEVQAPYGYVLDSEPVYFDVVQENSEEESGITLIEVVRSNMAQKGTI